MYILMEHNAFLPFHVIWYCFDVISVNASIILCQNLIHVVNNFFNSKITTLFLNQQGIIKKKRTCFIIAPFLLTLRTILNKKK